ncbi:MAG: hypothetical protein EOP04_19075 [Proteobacteria bacterium]|nr:MAG: hypothetical protein EOP04_19075 [Pseudomonadota bacterium]
MKTFGTTSGPVGVQSKFLYQKGTTCNFEVKFTNAGAKTISERVSLQSKLNEKVYSHRFTDVSVEPGKAVWYEMEKRECPLKWGESKDMNICASCAPALVFLK